MMQQHRNRPVQFPLATRMALPALLALGASLVLTGCGMAGSAGTHSGSGTSSTVTAKANGMVRGGQNPVTGASIQLYTVGTSGTGAAATPLLTTTVTTSDGSGTMDSNANAGNADNTLPAGWFTITGDYTCTGTTPGTQVYIVATGGSSGTGTNSNLSLVAALGSCANLLANAASTFINMDEVTTVAAAYALAPFATDLTHIGAANATYIANAFTNANSLANTATGTAGGASLPSGTVAPVSEINTLANILASCVNTTGASSSACTTLFGATGASDTFGAALYIARHPGASAVTALTTLSTGTAPFQPSLASTPNDYTLALNYTGSGDLATPDALAVDASGNVWVANESGTTVTQLSPSGSVLANLSPTGLYGAQGIAVDNSGNIWVANTAGNSVLKLTVSGGSLSATNSFTSGIDGPSALALDSAGNVFVANLNGNSVTELSNSGSVENSSAFSALTGITVPTAIAVGSDGSVYVTSGSGAAIKIANNGSSSSSLTDNTLQGPAGLAIDPASHNIIMTGTTTGSAVAAAMSEFTSAGAASGVSPVAIDGVVPAGVASDGTSIWVLNDSTSGSLEQFTFGSATPVSPSAGYGSLNQPVSVAVDGSGSVWTADAGSNMVTQYIGLAASVSTPVVTNVGP